jgi:hypothetical protein
MDVEAEAGAELDRHEQDIAFVLAAACDRSVIRQ